MVVQLMVMAYAVLFLVAGCTLVVVCLGLRTLHHRLTQIEQRLDQQSPR